jgi:hypothetical protein
MRGDDTKCRNDVCDGSRSADGAAGDAGRDAGDVDVSSYVGDINRDEAVEANEPIEQYNQQPILQECARLAAAASRKGYEIPQRAVLTTEEWTTDNGCLTSSLKICRPVLVQKFIKQLLASEDQIMPSVLQGTTVGAPSAWASANNPQWHADVGVGSDATLPLAGLATATQCTGASSGSSSMLSAGLKQVLRATVGSLASLDVVW